MTAAVRRVGAIAGKEFTHLRRDPRMVAAVLLMPVVQLLLFSYAISFDVKNVATVVVDHDRTAASRAYLQAYSASSFFEVRAQAPSLTEAFRMLERGQALVVVAVAPGMQATLDRGERAEVAVLVDGSETNAARIASTYATALNAAYGQQIIATAADRQGQQAGGSGMLEPRVRTWYNPERSSSIFLIPGLMVVIIMIVTVQQTAVTLVRERDQGTQEQMVVSPLRGGELMLGKLLPWTFLAVVDIVVITGVGMLVFAVPFRGSVLALALASVVFVLSALALGLIVSALSASMESANVVALLLAFLPAFLLSGFAFPISSTPVVLQWLSYAFPGRYLVEISRGVFLKGAGLPDIWGNLLALTGYAMVAVVLATLLYRRRRA